jgi:hypothetical protein
MSRNYWTAEGREIKWTTQPPCGTRRWRHTVGYEKAVRQGIQGQISLGSPQGEKTLQELAITYSVHPNMIALWKKQVLEHASTLFEKEGRIRHQKKPNAKRMHCTNR